MSYNSVFIDSLVRIKNAQLASLKTVELRFSKLFISSLDILKNLGYISGYIVSPVKDKSDVSKVLVHLRYYNSSPLISAIKIFSKPGKRVYVKFDRFPEFYTGMGVLILSTSKGVMSDLDALKLRVGGELLCGIF